MYGLRSLCNVSLSHSGVRVAWDIYYITSLKITARQVLHSLRGYIYITQPEAVACFPPRTTWKPEFIYLCDKWQKLITNYIPIIPNFTNRKTRSTYLQKKKFKQSSVQKLDLCGLMTDDYLSLWEVTRTQSVVVYVLWRGESRTKD